VSIEHLRIAAFCAYLGSWVVLGATAIVGAIPRRGRRAVVPAGMTTPVIVGTLLQSISALPITLFLRDGPLRPQVYELVGTLALAPFAAVLFGWAIWSLRSDTGAKTLITDGAYAWLRHPMYLAFLGMLVATGLLASAGAALVASIILYVVGSELRISSEEAELEAQFPADFAQYRLKTRWRYLPGLR
jgi:protein-S-isoprenylcysteine O-methyltransferase Ste14